jgi:hypothetical protein
MQGERVRFGFIARRAEKTLSIGVFEQKIAAGCGIAFFQECFGTNQ